jgi:hypothetical protein
MVDGAMKAHGKAYLLALNAGQTYVKANRAGMAAALEFVLNAKPERSEATNVPTPTPSEVR